MRILVTGAAGFVAFHLIQKLLREGNTVLGIDNFMSGQERNIADLLAQFPGQFSFIKVDINELFRPEISVKTQWAALRANASSVKFDIADTASEANNFQRIYHLACPASPPIYQKDMLHTLDTCYVGSRNIFELAEQHKARVLIASTSEIYGDPEVHPQPEHYRGNVNTVGIRSCYDEGKRAMETMGFIYREQHGVEVRTARIFNTYGPRMSPEDGRVLTNFISQALRGEALTIYGDGKQTRSFCYVDDLVRGLCLLMESAVTEPVNLGSQFEFTILEMAEKVRQWINPALESKFVDLPKDDPKIRRPDTSRAKELLGWEPRVSLEVGVKTMIEEFRRNLG
jgi:UDP-glucuronate decarboxylase